MGSREHDEGEPVPFRNSIDGLKIPNGGGVVSKKSGQHELHEYNGGQAVGLKLKNSARLAVSAGLCASLVMGGMPLNAIADELGVEKIDEAAGAAVEQNTAADQGDADHTVADQVDGQDTPETSEAPASDAASDAEPAAAEAVAPETEAASLVGKGTAEDPYQVATADDLRFVADKVNTGEGNYASASYKLTENINLENGVWTPIGDIDHKFVGTFDGNGKVISNLKAEDAGSQYVGLFGVINSPAKLMNITVENATVTGKAQVGVIAGSAFTGTVSNCTVKGSINVVGNYKVGGIAGEGYAALENCHVNATGAVTGNYSGTDFEGDNVGGLIGYRGEGTTPTTNCSVSGIKVSGTRKVGGLIGSAFANNQTTGCAVSDVSLVCNAPYDYANGSAKNQLCVGGLIGLFHKNDSNGGALSGCSINDVRFDVEDPQVKQEGLPILGIVSGGYRAYNFSSISVPDGQINIENLTISGNNTGSNAEQIFPGSVAMNGTSNVFSQGTGTAEDPYIISSVEDLELLAATIKTTGLTYEGQHLKIADDVSEIDMSGVEWNGIGYIPTKAFKGTFDGNGAAIKGLTKALFKAVNGATIKNLKLQDVKLVNASSTGALISGSIYGSTTIQDIEVTGSISGSDYLGAICGGRASLKEDDAVTIERCVNRANISGTGKAGGIAGYILNRKPLENGSITVRNCKNEGAVSGAYAGGITGMTVYATFEDCENTGAISGTEVAGGVIGAAQSGTPVTSCKNSAQVTCEKAAGGIVGSSSSGNNKVSQSANIGNVTGVTNAGGIIGGSGAQGDTVENCYNGGNITTTGNGESAEKPVISGGIFGYNNSGCPVKACVNDGKIVVSGTNAEAYQIGKSSYWYDQATGSKVEGSYFIQDGKIVLAPGDGKGEGIEQKDMTREQLAQTLNIAGGVANFWQAQNGSVQPDPLIPGAADGEQAVANAVVEVYDADGKLVERFSTLDAAFAAAKSGQTVKLVKNVEIDASIQVSDVKNVVLDLNGKAVEAKNSTGSTVHAFKVTSAGLTIMDSSKDGTGKISAMGTGSRGVILLGNATVVLESGAIEAAQVGIAINSGLPNQHVEMKGGTITSDNGILAQGNGTAGNTVVKVSNGEIHGKNAGILSNGAIEKGGVNITITGGTITATNASCDGLYLPAANSVTNITGGTITGASGIEIRAGELYIGGNAAIKATGTASSTPNPSGGTMLGAALSVVQHTTKQSIKVAIEGAPTFVGDYALWENNTQDPGAPVEGIELSVRGGSFDGKVYSADCEQFISDGSFKGASAADLEPYLAAGFGLNELPGGGYGVHEHVWSDKFESNKDGHWHACTKCDEKTEVVAHVEKTVGAKKATCGEDGYTGDAVCADCGYVIKKGSVIPATGKHAAGETWKVNGTSHWHECEDCGAKLDEAKHASSEWVVNNTDHWHLCDVCGAAFDVSAHDFGEWKVTKEATATEVGSREHTCKTCGKVVRESIPALTGTDVKPGKGDKLAQTGDTSLFAAAAAGIAGISTALAGVFTSRKKRDNK